MAEEISNKTLAVIVVAAIVVTLGSTALILRMGSPVITGMATNVSGTAAFNISGITSIRITDAAIDLGSGSVTAGEDFAVIDTVANVDNGTWTTPDDGFVIENDGNLDADISVNASELASSLIGGTSATPSVKWKARGTTANCQDAVISAYQEITTTSTASFCDNLSYVDASDDIGMDLQLTIPSDATPGERTLIVTFTATAT